jgi:hypothetical protein
MRTPRWAAAYRARPKRTPGMKVGVGDQDFVSAPASMASMIGVAGCRCDGGCCRGSGRLQSARRPMVQHGVLIGVWPETALEIHPGDDFPHAADRVVNLLPGSAPRCCTA